MARGGSAKRHAQAVFQLAIDTGKVEEWRTELRDMASALADPQLVEILENPKVPFDSKADLVRKCLPGASQHALNLAYLLVSRQRLGILESLVAEYERMANAHQGLEHATVVTAVDLDEEGKSRLVAHLERLTGKRILLATEVDPGIIGGFVARIGDRLIDGSTRARLEMLKRKLATTAS